MKKYFLYVRQYNIMKNDYVLYIYFVETEDIFHTMGEMLFRSFEHIKRIDFVNYTEETENSLLSQGRKILNWKDKYLNNEFYRLKDNYIFVLESQLKELEEDIKDFGGGEFAKLITRKIHKNTRYIVNRISDELAELPKEDNKLDICDVENILKRILKESEENVNGKRVFSNDK